jgi:hypothetical protein
LRSKHALKEFGIENQLQLTRRFRCELATVGFETIGLLERGIRNELEVQGRGCSSTELIAIYFVRKSSSFEMQEARLVRMAFNFVRICREQTDLVTLLFDYAPQTIESDRAPVGLGDIAHMRVGAAVANTIYDVTEIGYAVCHSRQNVLNEQR